MNSGLQCLSNTSLLTKYFLTDAYLQDINKDNPLGMSGKLAKAYAGLINDMWRGTDSKTAPWDLKKTLGSKISRFSGFGQQDSAELVNYLLDLLHEDLNRVVKKPIIEMSEELNRQDHVVAKEYWDAFTARNRSIISRASPRSSSGTWSCTRPMNAMNN
jgi:ubiquitin carboxyl-terminal hydrolase 4/11/15